MNQLDNIDGMRVLRRSRWYRTPAFPPGSGPDFVNGAAILGGEMPHVEILRALHRVESNLGRLRPARWSPRVCDLDLLGEGASVLPDAATLRGWMGLTPGEAALATPSELLLPHPRLHERAFVLVPLADVAPDWVHPLTGRSVAEMLAALPEAERAAALPME